MAAAAAMVCYGGSGAMVDRPKNVENAKYVRSIWRDRGQKRILSTAHLT